MSLLNKKQTKENKNQPDIVDCLINVNQDKVKLEDALRAIFMNTINRSFDDDPLYKADVLVNIRIAVGDEMYSHWEDLYVSWEDES